jgi:hypothetical protein
MEAAAAELGFMVKVPMVLEALPRHWDTKADLAAAAVAMHKALCWE